MPVHRAHDVELFFIDGTSQVTSVDERGRVKDVRVGTLTGYRLLPDGELVPTAGTILDPIEARFSVN